MVTKFSQFLEEDVAPPVAPAGSIKVGWDEAVITNINALLARSLNQKFLTPYIALEAIRKVLATYSIFLPAKIFMDSDEGDVTFDIVQFGLETEGQTHYIYFEWMMNEEGTFDVYGELVDSEELESLHSDEDVSE